jgi:WhiB family redox-sensing transcriptional regulator
MTDDATDVNDSTLQEIVNRLERLRSMPDSALADVVAEKCSCMDVRLSEALPPWLSDVTSDQELAARFCAGCPVQDHCLELELRTSGECTVGVWGALDENTRRVLFRYWDRTRRDQRPAASGQDLRPDGER